MTKKLMVSIVIFAAILFACASTDNYVTCDDYHVVVAGDTMDDVAWKYFKRDKRNICWDQYRYEVWKENERYRANGRALQLGDVMHIVWYEVRKP